ncbi:uncharacterized protein LOC124919580 [Impatiens glandulifera]|uniref:uncharacterized protein LOC124919580 n=1 Tax=Impatiens glandulifera TaxID=253017 RepID=UPI001FB13348|nr:uncharacterized protein LOC124919580 [Impatiens glandulifera]
MATLTSFLSFSPFPLTSSSRPRQDHPHLLYSSSSYNLSTLRTFQNPRISRTSFTNLTFASAQSSFGDFSSDNDNCRSKKSIMLDLVQEIEPLDVSFIQKDVSLTTIDAMKRTISSMLGLLPSDQFQVFIDALWEHLSKLLVSSMMTGYTLRNAELRLCLERNFDTYEISLETPKQDDSKLDEHGNTHDSGKAVKTSRKNGMLNSGIGNDNSSEDTTIQGLGEITPEARQYILHLQSRLSSVNEELNEVKRKTAALQMQQFVGEEKNDLLDYLRSLEPEKVVELSEPTCVELKEVIHSVVHGLLATLSPKMHSTSPPPPPSESMSSGGKVVDEDDCVDIVDNSNNNTSLHYQPLISLNRDYLARLLFWSMLLGHYLRGVEYRLELDDLLSLATTKTVL